MKLFYVCSDCLEIHEKEVKKCNGCLSNKIASVPKEDLCTYIGYSEHVWLCNNCDEMYEESTTFCELCDCTSIRMVNKGDMGL
jgi:RNA polymerase subunit RPABC4/transcription elongation factor Spt4